MSDMAGRFEPIGDNKGSAYRFPVSVCIPPKEKAMSTGTNILLVLLRMCAPSPGFAMPPEGAPESLRAARRLLVSGL